MTISSTSSIAKAQAAIDDRLSAIWTNLQSNHLWQRIFKSTLATTICVIIAVTPAGERAYGTAVYLAPIVTVFGHPGRRFGQMAEALVLALLGALVGMAWSTLGIYLASLIFERNQAAAYTIKALFLVASFLTHGILRSNSPRLYISVVLLVIVTVVSLTSPVHKVSSKLAITILYPILTGVAVLLVINIFVFPEFSSDFLGVTTIETLGEAVGVLRDAGKYFIELGSDEKEKAALAGDVEPGPFRRAKTLAEKPDDTEHAKENGSILRRLMKPVAWFRDVKEAVKEKTTSKQMVKLKDLTGKKPKLRAKLASCKAAQQECSFELAWAILPPQDLKPISSKPMKKLVSNVITLVGVCESKYALMGEDADKEDEAEPTPKTAVENIADGATSSARSSNDHIAGPEPDEVEEEHHWYQKRHSRKDKDEKRPSSRRSSKTRHNIEKDEIELIKPQKEIASGDVDLFKYLINHISKPLSELQDNIDKSVDVVSSCLAYCYDVAKLPSGALAPSGIELEEIDIRVDILADALDTFDKESYAALEKAALVQSGFDYASLDVMPRIETFVISAFILNLRQAALHVLDMLKHSRVIVEKCQARHERKRIYPPAINFKKWLVSGGEEQGQALSGQARKDQKRGQRHDEEGINQKSKGNTVPGQTKKTKNDASLATQDQQSEKHKNSSNRKAKGELQRLDMRLRNKLADLIEFTTESDAIFYAIKLTFSAFLVSWPAFVPQWNQWFYLNRALWAAIQLVLVSDVALGISIWTFFLRGLGTTLGCLWGYAAYESRHGNRVVVVVMLVIGIIPSIYVQLGSQYIKAGMVSTISMCIVAIATLDSAVPGTSTETFLRRLIAFWIGGIVALTVEVLIFPVRARDKLVNALATTIQYINDMEACIAQGVESGRNLSDGQSLEVLKRFDSAKTKAQGAMAAAETFLPFCETEPRLKGSFAGLGLIYSEILYVLHAIVDRMDDMLHLRFAYGSGVLEEFNTQVYAYRRNVVGSITLTLFAVHEGLTTKLPLPQYLPSARLAHLRLINRVREVVLDIHPESIDRQHSSSQDSGNVSAKSYFEKMMVKKIFARKFLAWNAAATGQIEVIEYLEELVDLVKLLVGVSEFRTGMFTRSSHREYIEMFDGRKSTTPKRAPSQTEHEGESTTQKKDAEKPPLTKREVRERSQSSVSAQDKDLPASLQRVRSRRVEEMKFRKIKSQEGDAVVPREEDEAGESSGFHHR